MSYKMKDKHNLPAHLAISEALSLPPVKSVATSPATRSRKREASTIERCIIAFLRDELGITVSRRQLWQLLHLGLAATLFLLAATAATLWPSLLTAAYTYLCYRPVSHLLKTEKQ